MIRGFENWLPAFRRKVRPVENPLGTRHVMIAICNRVESSPQSAGVEAPASVKRWARDFSRLREEFPDDQGICPRHTFFLPAGDAGSGWMPALGDFCGATGHEIEMAAPRAVESERRFREIILTGREGLAREGWLARDRAGAVRYGLIHEAAGSPFLPLVPHAAALRETGCYANLLPPLQPDRVPPEYGNTLCYFNECDSLGEQRGLRRVRAERETKSEEEDGLLLVPPPLTPDPNRKKFGLLPRYEAGELSADEPPSRDRMRLWLDCRITVEARPNWLFVTLHADGSQPENSRMLLGEPMREFYGALTSMSRRDRSLCFHCVTVRELVNILHAAEAGHSGNPMQFRDFRYQAPPVFSEGTHDCGKGGESVKLEEKYEL